MNKSLLIIAPIMLVTGLAGGYWFAGSKQVEGQPATGSMDRKILFYRSTMNPTVTSPVPAKDAMGMDYVPVYAESDKPKSRKILFYRSPMNADWRPIAVSKYLINQYFFSPIALFYQHAYLPNTGRR
jgi:Cu(I)/Ag(I) efflux system membrane fusion protein